MNETDQTVLGTIDLRNCRTRANYGTFYAAFLVEKSQSESDIYSLLKIDSSKYSIYISIDRMYRDDPRTIKREELASLFSRNLVYVFIKENETTPQLRFYDSYISVMGKIKLIFPGFSNTLENLSFSTKDSYFSDIAVFQFAGSSPHTPFYLSCLAKNIEDCFGINFDEDCQMHYQEKTFPYLNPTRLLKLERRAGENKEKDFLSLQLVTNVEKNIKNEENLKNVLKHFLRIGTFGDNIGKNSAGIKKAFEQLGLFYNELMSQEEVLGIAVFHTLVLESKRTINGIKVAKFFNQYFDKTADYASFKMKLETIYSIFTVESAERNSWDDYKFENIFVRFPGYKELRKTAIGSNSGKAMKKMMDIESINFDPERFPIVAGLIQDGSIPASTFFRKEGEETYFLFNDNWPLFEEFLARHQEIGIQLAQLASQRTTYEKGLMPYMYFILYGLPEYLKRHTGKTWTCYPKIVDSANELEPVRGEAGETTKKRSALTPIVDNEANTVIVPYACLKIPGISTTYTYSLDYKVVERGLSYKGNVCLNDLEKKLNGRDDYGLMFYTLTGSAVGRGYPTFLIIFENLDTETKIHFHRVHPVRSKDGDANPIHNWTRACYNWMAGNVNLDRIANQQGDLVFVSTDKIPDGERSLVDSYDQHAFKTPVTFIPYTKKATDNILGYFIIDEDIELNHPEHRTRLIPQGMYELRQCRSWEANPKGVWSLRID